MLSTVSARVALLGLVASLSLSSVFALPRPPTPGHGHMPDPWRHDNGNDDSPTDIDIAPTPTTTCKPAPTDEPGNNTTEPSGPQQNDNIRLGWPYGDWKVRGVNLGGWLVLEPWITPSLFENTGDDRIVDEYTFGEYQDHDTALRALKKHWDSWITEDDFAQIAAAGLNHVRLPVGFWAYDVSGGEPYVQGQLPYVDRAINWARNHGLKVLIELHGAPGSQNGFDNSGRKGDALWATDPHNIERAKNVLNTMAQKYAFSDVVTSIGLLNEPATFRNDQLLQVTRQFWRDAYGATRFPWAKDGSSSKSNLLIVIHDGFQPIDSWNGWMSEPNFSAVAIDTHYYQVFSDDEVSWDWHRHLQEACGKSNAYANSPNWLFVGEWSLAVTDCAQYLNGRGVGARYDGSYPGSRHVGNCNAFTGDGSSFSSEYKEFLRHFWDIQTQTFENFGNGWFFWTWKNERAAEWSYQQGVRQGWIPRDPSQHKYQWSDTCRR